MKSHLVLAVRHRDVFSELLEESGCRVLHLETIRTWPIEDVAHLGSTLDRINEYAGLFFTSPAAAEVFVEAYGERGQFGGKIYALGQRAKTKLESAGFNVEVNEANTVEELVESFDDGEFDDKKLLFLRGETSLGALPRLLDGRASLEQIVVYKTVRVRPDAETMSRVNKALTSGEIDWACFFSPSGVAAFMELVDRSGLHNVSNAAIGTTTAGALESFGMQADFGSKRATAEDFAVSFIEHIKHIDQ